MCYHNMQKYRKIFYTLMLTAHLVGPGSFQVKKKIIKFFFFIYLVYYQTYNQGRLESGASYVNAQNLTL